MNWIDVVLGTVIIYYGYRGYRQGFITIALELLGYIVAYVLAIKFGYLAAAAIAPHLPSQIPNPYIQSLGIAIIWIITVILAYIGAFFLNRLIPPAIRTSKINKVLGIIGSSLKALVILSLLLLILDVIPFSQQIQQNLQDSFIARNLLGATHAIGDRLNNHFSDSLENTIKNISLISNHFSSNNANQDTLKEIGIKLTNVTDSPQDEQSMFTFVNNQRIAQHLNPLKWNAGLTTVARNYARYMWANGFLAHVTPSGQTPDDRLKQANIYYTYIGENLAKAPNASLAENGLINSPEHRANILSLNFTDTGVGVMDGGQYGKIFVQEFIGK